jgi:phenylacetate-CoA ligase
MQRGFGVPVVDRYGADEIMQMADECPVGRRYHLIESTGIFEVLTERGSAALPGESGELVLTGLFSWSMPFIRYRLADQVTAGEPECGCGARLHTLQRIDGRLMDRFLLRDGRRIHPCGLDVPLLAEVPWLHKYQFVQESSESVRMRMTVIDGEARPEPAAVAELQQRIQRAISLPLTMRCEIVDTIEHRPGGKFRAYVPMDAASAGQRAAS